MRIREVCHSNQVLGARRVEARLASVGGPSNRKDPVRDLKGGVKQGVLTLPSITALAQFPAVQARVALSSGLETPAVKCRRA